MFSYSAMSKIFPSIRCVLSYHIRGISSTRIYNGENRVMKKLLKGTVKRKHVYSEAPTCASPKQYCEGSYDGNKSRSSRRVSVLNKLFMRHITDLMATGESSHLFLGHGIEINQVQVTPDFHLVKVYWIAKGTQSDEAIDELLLKHAGPLRHELTKLRVMGIVPKILFLKDKHFAQLMEVDLRLSRADFGDDHVPTEAASKLKTELKLYTSLEPHIKEQILKLDSANDEEEFEDMPPMPHNVLGLNYLEIMDKVKKAMSKSLAVHRLQSNDPFSGNAEQNYSVNERPIVFPNMKLQRDAFREFLAKQQLLKLKAKREMKHPPPEYEYLEEEWELKAKFEQNIDNDKYDDNDHIEEEEFTTR